MAKKLKIVQLVVILSVLLFTLVVVIVIVCINVFESNLQQKLNEKNGITSGVSLEPIVVSLVKPIPKKTLKTTNNTTIFFISANQPYLITNFDSEKDLTPCLGCYSSHLIESPAISGGYVTIDDTFAQDSGIFFTLQKPDSSLTLNDNAFFIKNPALKNAKMPWENNYAIIVAATAAGGGKEYIGSVPSPNPEDLRQIFEFEKLSDISSKSGVFLIKNVANSKYMRICDVEGCIGNKN